MSERDYVLGTHDAEIARLGVQHALWRPWALAAWQAAGIGPGATVLDVGAGPGHASMDLAGLVGRKGRVVAIERSRRFIDALRARARALDLPQVDAIEADVVTGDFGIAGADAAWCRWVLCFVADPGAVLRRIKGALRPGGVAVFHEYIDYRAWRLAPRVPSQEAFVDTVMASWRADGGEPDVGLALPQALTDAGFELGATRLHADLVAAGHPLWEWPLGYLREGSARLVDLGRMTATERDALIADVAQATARPATRMVIPTVLEVIARVPRAAG